LIQFTRPFSQKTGFFYSHPIRYHSSMLEQRIEQHFIDSADLKYQAAQVLSKPIAAAVQAILASVTSGGKVLACGNGGSAADAQHFAAEFVGRYERERPELGAIALTTDSSILTAIANDYDFSVIFSKQVRALGSAGDVLLAMSTSGNSANVLAAIEAAHERDMTVVALTGRSGGKMTQALRETDVHICVPHERTARIQEVHLLVIHCICDGVDAQLLGDQESST
jgi:D-sedoheptulose 7-phosphate isomerase